MSCTITCTRRIQFCAGHRVMGHENKCAHMHGHNYVAFITARGEELDDKGRVIDFSVIKERVGGWIDTFWDHGMILNSEDRNAIAAAISVVPNNTSKQKLYLLSAENPTAECLAKHLLDISNDLFKGTGVEVIEVTIWETENCYATVKASDTATC